MAMGFEKQLGSVTKENRQLKAEDCVLHFDSGFGISRASANFHTVITGTSGCGKTTNGIQPMLYRCMAAGYGGLIMDVKNNVTDYGRKVARLLGIDNKIVELGTKPLALRFNLLASMQTMLEVHDFFEELVLRDVHGETHNMDFISRGVGYATDIVYLLRLLCQHDSRFIPNLANVIELFNAYDTAASAYNYYLNNFLDKDDEGQLRLVNRIKSDSFHIFNGTEENGEGRYDSEKKLNQIWSTDNLRKALQILSDTPGFLEHFSHGNEALDMERLHQEGKIIFFRTGVDSGSIGPAIGRSMQNKYYAAVYKNGLHLPADERRFVLIDEFQDVADLGSGRFSDSNFIAKAREFRVIMIVATQSFSGLLANNANSSAVMSFISNCNNKIFFYNDDPMTRNIVQYHMPDFDLADLEPSKAVTVTYDAERRDYVRKIDSMNNEFRHICQLLANTSDLSDSAQEFAESREKEMSIGRLLNKLASSPKARENRMKHFFKKSDDSDELKSKTNDADQEATGNPEQPIFHEKRIMNQIAQSPSCDPWELSRKFPDLFSKKAPLQLTLPQGWVGFVEKCLESYQQAGLKAHIVRFGLLGGNLVVNFTQEDRQNDFRELLVTMLRQTANYCPFCGQPYASHPLYKYDNHVQVCDECLKKIGFDPNLNMHSDDDDAFDDDPEIMLAKN